MSLWVCASGRTLLLRARYLLYRSRGRHYSRERETERPERALGRVAPCVSLTTNTHVMLLIRPIGPGGFGLFALEGRFCYSTPTEHAHAQHAHVHVHVHVHVHMHMCMCMHMLYMCVPI